MKKHIRIGKKLFYFSLFGYVLSALSVFALPISEGENTSGLSIGTALVGIVFWVGILIGSFCFFFTWKMIHSDKSYMNSKYETKPAYLHFFRDRKSIILDSILIIVWIVILLGNYRNIFPDAVMLILMFSGLITLYLHFLINGRVFRYLFSNKKYERRRNNEGKD